MSKAIIHFLDSARGQYIPRDFARIIKHAHVQDVSIELLENLAKENSNEEESYWEDWQTVLDNARIIHDGIEYTLCHKGDLWLVSCDFMTDKEEEQDFWFED